MSDENDPATKTRDAIRRVREQGDNGADLDIVLEAAGHYADFVGALSVMFGPDPEASLEVEVGKAVQDHIEKAVTRGGPNSVQELGHAALAPVLARLSAASS